MWPQIKPIPDVVAYEGENTTLTCTASGVPTPDVKWISEGKEFFDEQVFIYNIMSRNACIVCSRHKDPLSNFMRQVDFCVLNLHITQDHAVQSTAALH